MRRSATSSLVSHTEQGIITFTNLLQVHKTVVLVCCTSEWEPDTCNNGKEILMLSYLSSISDKTTLQHTLAKNNCSKGQTATLSNHIPHASKRMKFSEWMSSLLKYWLCNHSTSCSLHIIQIHYILFRYRCLKLKMKLWLITWTSWQSFERGVVYWMWGKSLNCYFWAKVGPQYKKSASGYGWYSIQLYEWTLQIKQLGVTLAGTPSVFTYLHAQCSSTNVGLAQGPSIIEKQNM